MREEGFYAFFHKIFDEVLDKDSLLWLYMSTEDQEGEQGLDEYMDARGEAFAILQRCVARGDVCRRSYLKGVGLRCIWAVLSHVPETATGRTSGLGHVTGDHPEQERT